MRGHALLLQGRQLIQAVEAEALQELEGCAEQHRPAHSVQAADLGDKTTCLKRGQRPVRVDAANGLDACPSDRLLIGDDGEGLDGRWREPAVLLNAEELLDVGGGLGGSDHLNGLAEPLKADAASVRLCCHDLERLVELILFDLQDLLEP